MKIWQQFQALNKTLKRLSYAALAITLYALLGFLLLPVIVQPILVDALTEKLDRNATIESIKINPFALSVTINELSIAGKQTKQLIGFEKLVINFQALALFKQVIAFDEISIVRPNIKIILLANGQYNFDDIVASLSNAENADKEQNNSELESDEGWPIAIDKFRYIEGSVYFDDKNRKTEFKSQVENLSVSLDDFSTRPGDGNLHHIKAQTLRGTRFDWQGEFSLSPLKSKGQVELLGDLMVVSDYLQDQMRVKIVNGKLNIKTDYEFELAENASKFNISNMLASISELEVRRKDNAKIIAWKQVSLDLAELDLLNKKVRINKVSTNDVYINVEKDKNTYIDFGDLFVLQNLISKTQTPANAGADVKIESEQNWDINIENILSENSNIAMNDQSVMPVAKHELQFTKININNLLPFTDEVASFSLALKINNQGVVDIDGTVQPVSRLVDLRFRSHSIALKNYQSYINDILRIEILKGEFGASLSLNIDASKDVAAINIAGDMDVSSLLLRDKSLKEKFLSWNQLTINQFSLQLPQQKLKVSEVVVQQPYIRLVMNSGGETNIQKLFVEKASKQQKKVETKSNSKPSTLQADIENIKIQNAKMDFSDNSLAPNFSAGIYSLKGNISGLSSKQLSKARVDLKGKVDKYAPVTIKGEINPLTKDKYTEIEMLFKGIELTTFTPYSGKFAGYKIEKGKLSLDLKYKLNKNELVAENGVILDQLTLGDATDSEEATSLPINFALSLLKDSNGVIDFNLPIRGNIDDPDFQYGSLVWGALGNLIVGIVSSPFKALANLAGGDSEGLDYIVFSANDAVLAESEKNKLNSLAKALLQRPQLYLEIRGVASSLVDHDEIAYLKVRQTLKLKPLKLTVPTNENDRDEMVDYYETITKLSADDLLPKKHTLNSKQQNQYIYDKALIVILNKTQVLQAEYLTLAKQRAKNIQTYLIETGKVPSTNIFLLDSSTQLANEFEDVENARLQLPLSLKAK